LVAPGAIVDDLISGISSGDRRAIGQAITLVESTQPDHRNTALRLLEELSPRVVDSLRIGVTGSPGVGKSTFVEELGNFAIDQGRRVAVLAIDPTSTLTGGSILGDKTRMNRLSARLEAFIRPSPSGAAQGGVSRRTREAITILEAAHFDLILVETIGVGQSETMVTDMTDMLILLLLPAAGDDLQGIKRGIVELADLLLVNKADGDLKDTALRTVVDYQHALRLLPTRTPNWEVPVASCSALHGEGIPEIWGVIDRYRLTTEKSGERARRRVQQAQASLWAATIETLVSRLRADEKTRRRLVDLENQVVAGVLPATVAADRLIDGFLDSCPNLKAAQSR